MKKETQSLAAFVQVQYSPKSTPGYLNMIKRYRGYMGSKSITASYTEVLDYIGYLRKLKLHPKSLINNLFSIKIYYRWLQSTEQRKDHPCGHLILKDLINKQIPVESLYSKERLDELLKNHKNKRPLMQRRDEVIIGLLIYQGMTVQEITAINLEDVNLKEATIKAKGGYKQKSRLLALEASQIVLLHIYITEDRNKIIEVNKRETLDDKSVALILGNTGIRIYAGSINRLINTNSEKPNKLLPMKIRQSVIAHLLKSNNLRVVQVFAGHRRAASTEEYKQTGLEELKTLIQKLHPLESM